MTRQAGLVDTPRHMRYDKINALIITKNIHYINEEFAMVSNTKNRSRAQSKRNRTRSITIALSIVIVVLTVVLVVSISMLGNSGQNIFNNIDITNKALKGVTAGGVDISGMNKEEALAAITKASGDLLKKTEIKISIGGETLKYTAKDLGLSVDSETMIGNALTYGYTGTKEEREAAAKTAQSKGVDFAVILKADRETLKTKLASLKEKIDRQPVDASCVFMPRGYSADGTAYKPNEQSLIEACANGKAIALPDNIVRIATDQMPNKFRYEFYKETDFVKTFTPSQASISRFVYKEGVVGQSVNMDALADGILNVISNGDYSTPVSAAAEPTRPTVTLDAIKKSTQLIASWTSSYAGHNGYNRNWNLSKLSGIINGVVIQPGEEWSINKLAGNRTTKAGWLDAPGIENGGYINQPGGGVCQISSTLYNAVIRADLDITDSTHHSIISGYIPLGLDATISSGAPDLKIRNNQSTPVYIVSYTTPKEKNVTVEVYGQVVVDPQYGEVILGFTSEDLGAYGGAPAMSYVYNATVSYDGTPIEPGKSKVYAETRPGRKVQTYKHLKKLDGTEIKVSKFKYYQWKPINGTTYVNGTSPSALPTASPTPTPTIKPTATSTVKITPTPTPSATVKPSALPTLTVKPSPTKTP